MKKLILFTTICVLFFSNFSGAEPPPQRVNDFANIISQETEIALKKKLKQLDINTTIELVVVTIASLEGKSIEQYSVELGKKWRIGKKDKNNGILFIVAFKEQISRIEVGYGLEHILTDADTKKILRDVVNPLFKKRNFDKGFIAGVDDIITKITLKEKR